MNIDRNLESDLIRRAKKGDQKALNDLVQMHLPYIYKVAHKWLKRARQEELEDLISEGAIGFLRAVELFDPRRRIHLLTYADPHIQQAMRRYVSLNSSLLSGTRAKSEIFRIVKFYHELLDLGIPREDALRQTGKRFHIDGVEGALHIRKEMFCLDTHVGSDEEGPVLHELLPGPQEPDDERFDREELRLWIRSVVDKIRPKLSPLKRAILDRRILVHNDDPETLAEIARPFGLSRERVRQLEKVIWEQLRLAFKNQREPPMKGLPPKEPEKEPVLETRAAKLKRMRPVLADVSSPTIIADFLRDSSLLPKRPPSSRSNVVEGPWGRRRASGGQ